MKISITYVGKDQRYFETFKSDFSENYSAYTLAFRHYFIDEENSFVKVFDSISEELPNILFLDFSTEIEGMTNLLNLFVSSKISELSLIGLYPQLDNDKNRDQRMRVNLELGIDANIIKSGNDFLDPTYIGMRLALPKYLINPSLYELKNKEGLSARLIDIGKVNYLTKNEIECETNLEIIVGHEVEIENSLPTEIVESSIFVCNETENINLNYKRNFRLKLQPIFLDYIFEKEELTKLERLKLVDDKERRDQLIETKNLVEYEKWIEDESGDEVPNLVKLGVIDRNLVLLKDESYIDISDTFLSRVWGDSKKCEKELILFQPDILVYQLEPENEISLERLVKFIKLNEFEPYLVIFGAIESTELMREKLSYSKLISNPENIYLNAISGLIKAFDQKKSQMLELDNVKRLSLTKEMPLSNFLISHPISVLYLTEYSIDFRLESELVIGSFFKMDFPSEFVVRITSHLESSPYFSDKTVHHGVIHSITNDEKKKLRQYLQQQKK